MDPRVSNVEVTTSVDGIEQPFIFPQPDDSHCAQNTTHPFCNPYEGNICVVNSFKMFKGRCVECSLDSNCPPCQRYSC